MTVKEIAEICNVSEQSIRNWCKKNNVCKVTNTVGKASFVIDDDVSNAIMQYYHISSQDVLQSNKESLQREQSSLQSNKESLQSNKDAEIQALKEQIVLLKEHYESNLLDKQKQIEDLKLDKDKQIETLQLDKMQLQEQMKFQLESKDRHIEGLLEQLTAERLERQTILAKYIGMNEEQEEQQEEVKATVVEPEPVKAEQEPTEQEEQSQKKQGFFSRLFKRK